LVIPWGVGRREERHRRRVQAQEVLADPERPRGIDHVLDGGLHQPQVAEQPEQEHRRQQQQREQVEGVAELACLADEGDGDDRAGQGAEYRVERPLASAMVPMRAVWRLNCSVVSADSASWRASGSVGWSMASPSPA
jgi:hypothetical protein